MRRTTSLLAASAAAAVLFGATSAQAQDCTPPRILFVLDASSTMTHEIGGTTKWQAAIHAVQEVLDVYPEQAEYGLMPFPGPGAGCSTGVVQVDVGPDTGNTITGWMVANTPPSTGAHTPAGQTLMAASNYGLITDPAHANVVIFVSDGWQWCSVDGNAHCVTSQDCTLMGVNPCPTCLPTQPDGCYCVRSWPELGAQALAAEGVATYVVGFGDAVDALTLNGAAWEGGTALPQCDPTNSDPAAPDNCYLQASEPSELTDALAAIVQTVTTEDCLGECEIPGTRTCDSSGWSDCIAPTTIDCTSSCDTAGTQQCMDGELTPCSSEVDCGSGGSGGAGNAGNTGGAGNAGNTGGAGNTGPSIPAEPEELVAQGGCGCRVAGTADRRGLLGPVAALLGLGAIGWRRRRTTR